MHGIQADGSSCARSFISRMIDSFSSSKYLVPLVRNFGLRKTFRRITYTILLKTLGSLKSSYVEFDGLKMHLIPDDIGISRELRVFGIHEPLSMFLLERILRKGMNVLDVGSNIGYFALLEAKTVGPAGKVVAIEPNPVSYQYLMKNIRINSFSNICPRNIALWNKDGWVDFVVLPQSNLCHTKEVKNDDEIAIKPIKVSAKTLDNLVAEIRRQDDYFTVDLIRMDVEGAEWQIFNGAWKTIRKYLPQIFIELHVSTIGREKAWTLLTKLRDIGYNIQYLVSRDVNCPLVADHSDVKTMEIERLASDLPLLDMCIFLKTE